MSDSSARAELVKKLNAEGDYAADYLEELLDIADLDGDIEISVESDRAAVAVVTDGTVDRRLKRLIGDNGEVLDSLQELARLAVQAKTGERSRLMLDIAGHRAAHREEIAAIAQEAIAAVFASGESVALKPMNPFERKVVHDFAANAGLVSDSEGIGPARHVIVSLPSEDGSDGDADSVPATADSADEVEADDVNGLDTATDEFGGVGIAGADELNGADSDGESKADVGNDSEADDGGVRSGETSALDESSGKPATDLDADKSGHIADDADGIAGADSSLEANVASETDNAPTTAAAGSTHDVDAASDAGAASPADDGRESAPVHEAVEDSEYAADFDSHAEDATASGEALGESD